MAILFLSSRFCFQDTQARWIALLNPSLGTSSTRDPPDDYVWADGTPFVHNSSYMSAIQYVRHLERAACVTAYLYESKVYLTQTACTYERKFLSQFDCSNRGNLVLNKFEDSHLLDTFTHFATRRAQSHGWKFWNIYDTNLILDLCERQKNLHLHWKAHMRDLILQRSWASALFFPISVLVSEKVCPNSVQESSSVLGSMAELWGSFFHYNFMIYEKPSSMYFHRACPQANTHFFRPKTPQDLLAFKVLSSEHLLSSSPDSSNTSNTQGLVLI